jgi:hypothetical protein
MGVLLEKVTGLYKMGAIKRSIAVWLGFQVALCRWHIPGKTVV